MDDTDPPIVFRAQNEVKLRRFTDPPPPTSLEKAHIAVGLLIAAVEELERDRHQSSTGLTAADETIARDILPRLSGTAAGKLIIAHHSLISFYP